MSQNENIHIILIAKIKIAPIFWNMTLYKQHKNMTLELVRLNNICSNSS